ncbi:MAG TPA: ATP-binding protein [Terracidiphilus sp.]
MARTGNCRPSCNFFSFTIGSTSAGTAQWPHKMECFRCDVSEGVWTAEAVGLGPRICRSIMESHGGRLWATANAGRGTTFHFTLPTRQRSQHR